MIITWSFPLLFADIRRISFTLPPHLTGSYADVCLFMPLRAASSQLRSEEQAKPSKTTDEPELSDLEGEGRESETARLATRP